MMIRLKHVQFYFLVTFIFLLYGCPEVLDIFPPEVKIISPSSNEIVDSDVEVVLSVSDNEQIDKVELEILDTTDGKVASSQLKEPPWQHTFSLENDGNYTLKVKAVDLVGNFTEKTGEFVVNQYGDYESITVINPNGGETWNLGSSQNITWSSNNVSNYIGIQLYSGTSYVTSISSSTVNDGVFNWNVPSSITLGDDYRVRIYSISDSDIEDYSDSYFSIGSGYSSFITVNTPNGGETWKQGSSQEITWSSSNIPGVSVKICLWDNDNFSEVLSEYTLYSDGSYIWSVPLSQNLSNNYKIKIFSNSDIDIQDLSDNYFSIVPSQGGEPPSDVCNIPHSTTGTTFTYVNPEQNIYNFGDTYTATLYSSLYSVGQQGGAVLRLNENTVYNFGSWLVFNSDGSRDFTLPSQSDVIVPSNCYTLVIIGYNLQDEYVSEPFTIY